LSPCETHHLCRAIDGFREELNPSYELAWHAAWDASAEI
jgi:hypothetical protein